MEEKNGALTAFKMAGDLGLGLENSGCPNCGAELNGGEDFCKRCGFDLKKEGSKPVRKAAAKPPVEKKADPPLPKNVPAVEHGEFFQSGGNLVIKGKGKRPPKSAPTPKPTPAPEPVKPVVPYGKHSSKPVPPAPRPAPKPTPTPIPKRSTTYSYPKSSISAATTTISGAPAPRPMAPGKGGVVLKADIMTKQVKNNSGVGMKELIRDIHMEIREGTLVALLGTAGAGKSTVMNCLNGMDLQGVQGTVYYRGVDLMRNFEQMKYMIGSVPQKKVFHGAFTPEEEFTQAAMLRLPADTTDREIKQRVDKTLEMLSMNGVRKTRNSKLSGGEQTRVNVGIELVADRDLLCLDEPDQGLSPNYKHELFEIMRNLAHNYGKTVLSIIHDVSEIDLFDQVVMLAKVNGVGRLAFSGSPAEARAYFGVDIRDAYALLEREPERFVK